MIKKRLWLLNTILALGLMLGLINAPLFAQAAQSGVEQTQSNPILNGASPKILINEFYRSGNLGTTDEWVEIVLVQDLTAAALGGFYVGDSTASTLAKFSGYQFTSMSSIASNFPAGTIIVIGGDTAFVQDTSYDPSNNDWNILLRTSGGYLTSNGSSGDLASTDVVYVDTDGTNGNTTISADGFAVNWDSTPGTLGANSDVTITVPANISGVVLTSDLSGATLATNWTTSVPLVSLTMGQPNGGNNTSYIDSLRQGGVLETTLTKTVTPTTNVAYHGTVTYTLALNNSMAVSDTVLLTDTLPAEVDFGAWISNPVGASITGDEITWNGTLTAATTLTFTFTATHIGDYGDIITNTAEFSGTAQAGTADAVFNVVENMADVTFTYHDLEGVVQAGDTVWLAGNFNSWTPVLMGDAGGGVYTHTLTGLVVGNTYAYRYIVDSGGQQWDWLNTANRSLDVTGSGTLNDYRNVTVGWANLQSPPTLEANYNTPSDPVYGQLYIYNVTNPSGVGRGLKAEVGYGNSTDPAAWTWSAMSFNTQIGNNDEFMGSITPTAAGVFSYTTRYDGNWGVGNPNAGWTYGDLDGVGPYPGGDFSLDQTGVMTVTLYDVALTKTANVSEILVRDGVETPVSYTLSLENLSTLSDTTTITLSDILPFGFVYASDDSGITPTGDGSMLNPLTWVVTDTLAPGDVFSFTLVLSATDAITQSGLYTNTAMFLMTPMDWEYSNNTAEAAVQVNRVVPIAEARALPENAFVCTSGYVNFPPGLLHNTSQTRDEFMMQDAALGTAGIDVYYSGSLTKFAPFQIGEQVVLCGIIDEYNGKLEVVVSAPTDVFTTGEQITLTPWVRATNQINESTEGILVQVQGEVVNATGGYLDIDDGSGQIRIYVDSDTHVSLADFAADDYVQITSVATQYNTTYEIIPRFQSDLLELYPTTFIYHDLEDVIPAGVVPHVAGNFNGWSSSALAMTGADGVYTASVLLEVTAPYTLEYKIIAGDSWDNGGGDLLNTDNRQSLITAPTTLYLYRNVRAGYAKLLNPPAITIVRGESTPAISGESWFSNLPFGTNQALHAQIGYGTDADPTNWTWVAAAFSGRNGNNDIFTATLTPAAVGVYSYAVRFDGNWGTSNPNTTWYLGDLDGVYPGNGFDIGNVGVLTVLPITHTLTLAVTGNGTVVPAAGDHVYNEDTVVPITATAAAGWEFTGWLGDVANAGAANTTVTVDADKTVTATFEAIPYTLTINIVGQGEVTQVPSQTTYLYGDVVTLTAIPDTNWTFVEWSGDVTGTLTETTVTILGNAAVTATFEMSGGPQIEITKSVEPAVDVSLGSVVTYTIALNNTGDADALGVLLTDTLPSGVTFGGFVVNWGGFAYADGTVTWSGDLLTGVQPPAAVFTATVSTNRLYAGATITNRADYTSDNAGSGYAEASFQVKKYYFLYLPFTTKNFTP